MTAAPRPLAKGRTEPAGCDSNEADSAGADLLAELAAQHEREADRVPVGHLRNLHLWAAGYAREFAEQVST